ncbi:unnamed protein product [Rhizoctonia solani]|nr:unnamed protein product [Rhizoctonia solani]
MARPPQATPTNLAAFIPCLSGTGIPNSYLVKLKASANLDQRLISVQARYHNDSPPFVLQYKFNPDLINGYSASMGQSVLKRLQKRSDVEAIYQTCK